MSVDMRLVISGRSPKPGIRSPLVADGSSSRRDLVAHTRLAIEALLPYQRASLTCVAEYLRMHKNTLKRALGQRGINFRELHDEVRFQLAANYLENVDLPIAQIGAQLGFAEENSFFRAFKRWTGGTPGAYRRRTGEKAGGRLVAS